MYWHDKVSNPVHLIIFFSTGVGGTFLALRVFAKGYPESTDQHYLEEALDSLRGPLDKSLKIHSLKPRPTLYNYNYFLVLT